MAGRRCYARGVLGILGRLVSLESGDSRPLPNKGWVIGDIGDRYAGAPSADCNDSLQWHRPGRVVVGVERDDGALGLFDCLADNAILTSQALGKATWVLRQQCSGSCGALRCVLALHSCSTRRIDDGYATTIACDASRIR